MDVVIKTFRDEDEAEDYSYVGVIYTFREGGRRFFARKYQGESSAAFMGIEMRVGRSWRSIGLKRIPYDDALFAEASRYLLENGVKRLDAFLIDEGYHPVDTAQLRAPRA